MKNGATSAPFFYFENTFCVQCNAPLGFDPQRLDLVALQAIGCARRGGDVGNGRAQERVIRGLDEVKARLAELEKRLTRIDMQSQAASGNAARAEGLLIAYAARRTLDRGAPLGYLEDQLRLRFADAQPNAVETLIAAAHSPVTLDSLYAQLEALAPKLAGAPAGENSWGRVKRELAGLFVIRQQSGASVRPEDRVTQAKLLLTAGKTSEAVAEVERLPGAAAAQPWIAAARRYDAVQRALDLIETTAMLEPHRLNDGAGTKVDQPSPLAPPGV